MIAANKKFIIVSDSDQTSKNKRKDFEKSFPDHKGCWLEYDVVNKDIKTLEDFIKPTIIENFIKEMEHNGFRYDLNKNAITNIEQCIKEQEKRQECKKKIIVAIKKEDIKETYSEFSNKLKSKLESL